MAKITFIGAGSVVFASRLLSDIFSHSELAESTISLMDINPERLDLITKLARLMAKYAPKVKIESTLNRRESLKDADYVIIMIQVGA